MSLGGKRDDFSLADLVLGGRAAEVPPREVEKILREVTAVVSGWRDFAQQAGVKPNFSWDICDTLRLDIR
jgi:serine/threonine-protein kinase HipA